MTTRKIMIDGIGVEMEERDLQVVERRIGALETELATAKTELATAKTTAQNDVATARTETANATAVSQTKDAEIATLKQQLADATITAEKLDARADARAQVKQRAKALLDTVVLDKKSDEDIRRQVVNATLGDTAKDWTDDMVTASFNTLANAVQDSGNGLSTVVNILAHQRHGRHRSGARQGLSDLRDRPHQPLEDRPVSATLPETRKPNKELLQCQYKQPSLKPFGRGFPASSTAWWTSTRSRGRRS